MTAPSLAALLGLLAFLTLCSPVFAQEDPCSGYGSDCRLMTSAEVNALKERLFALRAALPVPDPARWAMPSDVGESYTMRFVAESNLGGTLTCSSWPSKILAPVKSVVLEITGPNKAEIAALKQKINRKAFEALLGGC